MAKPKTPKEPAAPKARKPKIYTKLDEWLIKRLRQLSMEWPAKELCLTAAYRGPGRYECAHCKQMFKDRYALKADHVDPVVDPVEGFVGIPTYVERLFAQDPAAWQALCAPCHQTKTNEENAIRRAASKARLANPEP